MRDVLEAAKVAAQWWTNKIRGGAIHDNGADDETNVMAMLMANIIGFKNAPSEEQLEKFNKVLAGIIDEELMRDSSYVYLNCDYDPCGLLGLAADQAKINPLVFPYKTSMSIYKDKVVVRDGYGKPQKEIWNKKNPERENERGY